MEDTRRARRRGGDLRETSPFCTLHNRIAKPRALHGMAVKRVNDSVLGALERPALAWMADRLPAWASPNHLTVIGTLGALITGAGFVLSHCALPWLWRA